jgi:hypothetical protein
LFPEPLAFNATQTLLIVKCSTNIKTKLIIFMAVKLNRMKKLLLLLFTLSTIFQLNLIAQGTKVQFLEKEKGYITKDGCKVRVKYYYGLSENH